MREKTAPKKRGRKPTLDPELVAAALAELDGNVKATAERFNVHRSSVQNLIDKRPALQKVLHDAREGMLDTVESSLYTAAKNGEAWAVCFFLKTQGKARGYIEKADDQTAKPDQRLDDKMRKMLDALDKLTQPGSPASPGAGTLRMDAEDRGANDGVQVSG